MIEFRNLRKSFGEREIIKGINLKILKGEIVFLLGTSGTGKSVTLRLIVGLLKATSGDVFIDGENVTEFSEYEFLKVRRKCGMVFQHPALFDSLTVYENVAFGLRQMTDLDENQIKERVIHSLSLVNVDVGLHLLPQNLSYGTQKRVSLARTVCLNPEILLFDEPTTGLDPVTTNAVNRLILNLSRELKTTSLVVSHDMKCAMQIADRIVVLDKGNIVEVGTPDQIKKSSHPLVQDFMLEVTDGH